MTPHLLSIDPGCPGAAVLFGADGRPGWAASWKWVSREGEDLVELTYEEAADRPLQLMCKTLAGVGAYLGAYLDYAPVHLVAEGLYVASVERSEAALSLGKSVGWLTARLREQALSYEEIRASEWRPSVLGCRANEDSDRAEGLALSIWRPVWRGSLRDNPHVAEAHALGLCRRAQLRCPQPGLALELARPRRRSL